MDPHAPTGDGAGIDRFRPVVLTDLDDTLFTTMKGYAVADPDDLTRVATGTGGNHSYMCSRRRGLWNWLGSGATVIPVTARGAAGYSRVALEFRSGAVIANGATVLDPAGRPDPEWHRLTETLCQAALPRMQQAQALCRAAMGTGAFRMQAHPRGAVLAGLTLKSNSHAGNDAAALHLQPWLDRLRQDLPELSVAVNGNALQILPPGISKLAAVRHLLASRPDLAGRPLIGAGDSPSDLPFMQLCDFALIPRHSRNSEAVFKGLEN